MKATNIDVAVARDGVGQTLVESSHALARGEDGGYSGRDSWVLNEQSINVDINWDGLVRQL